MFERLKNQLSEAVLGELVEDWGDVYRSTGGFFEETTRLSLHRQRNHWVVWLGYKYKSAISYNQYGLGIDVHDLEGFVRTLRERYDDLCGAARGGRPPTPARQDRLPFAHRAVLRVIHGLRTSRMLLDLKDPDTGRTEFRCYGYVTRKSEIKVFLQSDLDISNAAGHVISGAGLDAALQALSGFLERAS